MLTRRDLLKALAALGVGGGGFSGYALAEAAGVSVTTYRLTPPGWTPGLKLRLAALGDFHVCDPWMSLARVEALVDQTNALGADAILLLGDFVPSRQMSQVSRRVPDEEWATALGLLKAPLGVHAVLGNHDWWEEIEVQRRRRGPTRAGAALEAAGIRLFENHALRLSKDGRPFWLAGLGSQWAFWSPRPKANAGRRGRRRFSGIDDLPRTIAQIADDAPVVLMAHEPDIFPEVPARVSLTLAGHTHGGQVRFFGYAPFVPSRYGSRYLYGHKVEDGRHLIVTSGLGCSGLPLRIGAPPEIVLIELGSETTA